MATNKCFGLGEGYGHPGVSSNWWCWYMKVIFRGKSYG